MFFSLVLYTMLVSVVSAALFHVLVYHYRIDCCNCFTILHYSYKLMNFWYCTLVNLSNQKSSSYGTDNGRSSVLSRQSVMKDPKCFYC